jgi:hypothetical protein
MDTPESEEPNVVDFETQMASAAAMFGQGAQGHLLFMFFGPHGVLRTRIGPDLAGMLYVSLHQALTSMARLPDIPVKLGLMGSVASKNKKPSSDAITSFGQNYPRDIVEALGVLMIRAHILERNLLQLFASISGMSMDRAAAVFYSTVNTKARLDMIRVLLPHAIPETNRADVAKTLDQVASAASERNHLVHGTWTFQKDKFLVTSYDPKNPKTDHPVWVTAKSINDIAEKFHTLGVYLSTLADTHAS